ncbi:PREDICTED: NFATC2-interacting protein [Crocodylus porosus]|uniref:NFATC2-interacting protein n=1 Tax=Crocodylus porosus TaxID=8502 RepID=UPI00093E8108|nr:PREDICTED: NFATC2-interacting protein [Crocodylus porosus]
MADQAIGVPLQQGQGPPPESSSDSDVELVDTCPRHTGGSSSNSNTRVAAPPRPKRRRLPPSTRVVAVPIYSSKVNRSFQLCPLEVHPAIWEGEADLEDFPLPAPAPCLAPPAPAEKKEVEASQVPEMLVRPTSPSPPPSPVPTRRRRGCTHHTIRAVEQQLQGLSSLLSAAQRSLRTEPDADVVFLEAPAPVLTSPPLRLKVRCRGQLHRLPLDSTQPLRQAAEQLAQLLGVLPSRVLLLWHDRLLEPSATPHSLGLGVADILDCVVEPVEDSGAGGQARPPPDELSLTVRGRDPGSQFTFSVPKTAPLSGLMGRYRAAAGLDTALLRFVFDGRLLPPSDTPEELGLEPGDVIEAWN